MHSRNIADSNYTKKVTLHQIEKQKMSANGKGNCTKDGPTKLVPKLDNTENHAGNKAL